MYRVRWLLARGERPEVTASRTLQPAPLLRVSLSFGNWGSVPPSTLALRSSLPAPDDRPRVFQPVKRLPFIKHAAPLLRVQIIMDFFFSFLQVGFSRSSLLRFGCLVLKFSELFSGCNSNFSNFTLVRFRGYPIFGRAHFIFSYKLSIIGSSSNFRLLPISGTFLRFPIRSFD